MLKILKFPYNIFTSLSKYFSSSFTIRFPVPLLINYNYISSKQSLFLIINKNYEIFSKKNRRKKHDF